MLFLICSHLDLRSLIQLSSTCRYFREQCLHPLQFRSLNLQPYWNSITNNSIENFFVHHCIQTRCLSLAWTKSIQHSTFNQLLSSCSTNLIQLDLACCQYLTGDYIEAIANYCPNLEILNLENCLHLNKRDFIPLKNLHHIRSLNVYRTSIDYRTLLPLIDNNKEHLENINLGKISIIGKKLLLSRRDLKRRFEFYCYDLY
jgi:F-box/leucine-rich repeat protein 4